MRIILDLQDLANIITHDENLQKVLNCNVDNMAICWHEHMGIIDGIVVEKEDNDA